MAFRHFYDSMMKHGLDINRLDNQVISFITREIVYSLGFVVYTAVQILCLSPSNSTAFSIYRELRTLILKQDLLTVSLDRQYDRLDVVCLGARVCTTSSRRERLLGGRTFGALLFYPTSL